MKDKEHQEIVTVMAEGILAAFLASARKSNDPVTSCRDFARAALASLESAGFKVVRDVQTP